MRLAHLNTNLSWGGGENQMLHLVKGTQDPEFHSLLIARRNGKLLRQAQAESLPVEAFDFISRNGPLSMGKLAGILRTKEATHFHLHDGDAVSLGVPAAWMHRQVKTIVHRRIASPLRGNFWTRWKYSPKRVDAFVAVSRSAQNALLEFGIPQDRIHLIPSGIDLAQIDSLGERSKLRSELGFEAGLWIGTVTTLSPKKNNETFIRMAASLSEKIPEARFLIVGDGPEKSRLSEMAQSLGLTQKIRFIGFQEQAVRYTAALDAFVFTSTLEGSPGALKEAMAVRVPVVAANAPGNEEIVRTGTGILVPSREPEVYADAVKELFRNSAKTRLMTDAAEKWVRQEFSMEKMVERTKALYRKLG